MKTDLVFVGVAEIDLIFVRGPQVTVFLCIGSEWTCFCEDGQIDLIFVFGRK